LIAYRNEKSVGTAILQSALKREELYITTKYDGGDIRKALEKSLEKVRNPRLVAHPQFCDKTA